MLAVAAELRLGTPEEKAALDAASHVAWGGGLPIREHLAREARLRDTAWSRGALSTWVWEGDEGVLASCETYAVPSAVEGSGGLTWAVASVFTPEARRGKGHASRMLAALVERLALVPDAQAVVLFSDVGEAMYARLGFAGLPAWDRVFSPEEGSPEEGVDRLLPRHSLERHWRPPEVDESASYWLAPTGAQLAWHVEAGAAGMEAAGREPLAWAGARVGDAAIAWCEAPEVDQLRVLDLVAPDEAVARRLLRSAARAARQAGLAAVVAWESTDGGPWPETLGHRRPRAGQVPMLLSFRHEVDPLGWTRVPRGLWV
jgi:hypothetical protein